MLNNILASHGARWEKQQETNLFRCPTDFGDVYRETEIIEKEVGVYPSSHWGRMELSGKDHLDFLQNMTTNDLMKLKEGTGLQAVFTENRGRIIDVGNFYCRGEKTMCVLSPYATEEIMTWLERFIFAEEVTIENFSKRTEMFDIIGSKTADVAKTVFDTDIEKIDENRLLNPTNAPINSWIAKTSFGSHYGLRVIVDSKFAPTIWQELINSKALPIGERAWNTIRIENCIPARPSELNEDHNPWEAGLGSVIDLDKGCYIGQEVIARLNAYDKIKQHLRLITFEGKKIPNPKTNLVANGKIVGQITSSALSPFSGVVALAYITRQESTPGTRVETEHEIIKGQIKNCNYSI